MSHAATNGRMKKTDYKDYVSFLGTYKSGGRKEDQASVCSSDSGISIQSHSVVSRDSSSTSLNSDTSDTNKCTSYNNYLEIYNNKKFSSVKLSPQNANGKSNDHCKLQNDTTDGRRKAEVPKTIKSEIFVHIVNPERNVGQITRTFEIPGHSQKPTLKRQNSLSNGIKNMVDTFESKQKSKETPALKPTLSRSNSVSKNITNKQKQFTSATLPRKSASGKPLIIQKVNVEVFEAKKDSDEIDNSFLLKRNNSLNSSRSKKHFASIHKLLNETVVSQQTDQSLNGSSAKTEPPKAPSVSTPAPLPPSMLPKCSPAREMPGDLNFKVTRPNGTPPLPPPLPPNHPSNTTINTNNNNTHEVKVVLAVCPVESTTAGQVHQPPSPPSVNITTSAVTYNYPSPAVNCIPPPPPPPLPTMSMNAAAVINVGRTSAKEKPAPFSSSTLPRHAASGPVIQKAGVKTGEPAMSEALKAELIKKQAYTMLRGMYGSYHDQANGYIAKLPSYMVKKDNGLKDIITNIEAQGGLEKLNGRVNPNLEAE